MGINHDIKTARDALMDTDRAVAEADRALQEALVEEYGVPNANTYRYTTKRLTDDVEALKRAYLAATDRYHEARERAWKHQAERGRRICSSRAFQKQ
jgi:hypothetical protein